LTIHKQESDLNVYAYVHGSVLKKVDPVGLEEELSDDTIATTLSRESAKASSFSEQYQRGKDHAVAEFSRGRILEGIGRFFEGVWEGLQALVGNWRTLSVEEVKMLKSDYGDGLRYSDIFKIRTRVVEGIFDDERDYASGYNLYLSKGRMQLYKDPAFIETRLKDFFHEITHIQQNLVTGNGDIYKGAVENQRIRDLEEKLHGEDNYNDHVMLTEGKSLRTMTVEQNAQIGGLVMAARHYPQLWIDIKARENYHVDKEKNEKARGYEQRARDALESFRSQIYL
jgi:hypothetical protein